MVFVVGISGIYSLRALRSFRTLIKTIVACLREMVFFIILLAMIVIIFAIMDYSIDDQAFNERNYFENLGDKYRTVFNDSPDFIYSKNGALNWIIYYLFTILVHTIMLNLLIKLVSDTYTNIQGYKKSADAKVKIQMLTEIGLLK